MFTCVWFDAWLSIEMRLNTTSALPTYYHYYYYHYLINVSLIIMIVRYRSLFATSKFARHSFQEAV